MRGRLWAVDRAVQCATVDPLPWWRIELSLLDAGLLFVILLLVITHPAVRRRSRVPTVESGRVGQRAEQRASAWAAGATSVPTARVSISFALDKLGSPACAVRIRVSQPADEMADGAWTEVVASPLTARKRWRQAGTVLAFTHRLHRMSRRPALASHDVINVFEQAHVSEAGRKQRAGAEVDLEGRGLSSLHASASEIPPDVRALFASHNRLVYLPHGLLSSATGLCEIDVTHNLLVSLPPLTSLRRLQALYASHNRIAAEGLPESLFALPSLLALSLSHNRLEALPQSVRYATRLEALFVSHNALTELPRQIAGMVSLQELHADHNRLVELPAALVTLPRLHTVDVAHNGLRRLPARLGDLARLRTLHANHNELRALPASTVRLTRLCALHVQCNRIDFLPAGLSRMPHLTSLRIEGNAMASDSFSRKARRKLTLVANRRKTAAGGDATAKDLVLSKRLSSIKSAPTGVHSTGEHGEAPPWAGGGEPMSVLESSAPGSGAPGSGALGSGRASSGRLRRVRSEGAIEELEGHARVHEPRRYDPCHSQVSGFLIDLDGTIYRPGMLIPGAEQFYGWLRARGLPFVFLSNTGAKGSDGVIKKLATPAYELQGEGVEAEHVHTAAEAQVRYLIEHVKPGSKVFALSGGDHFWLGEMERLAPGLLASWDLCFDLSDDEFKRWATLAAKNPQGGVVWLVLFSDGAISAPPHPQPGGRCGVSDWSYELIKHCGYLVAHGAEFVYTADDSSNPSTDDSYPGWVFPQAGPGMFAAAMRTLMYPDLMHRVHCLGKGGNEGRRFMMEAGIEKLIAQGHSGDRSKILMVGDRYDTDVLGGMSVGVQTCLVLSGCHRLEQQKYFPHSRPDYFADSVMELHNFDEEEVGEFMRREEKISDVCSRITQRWCFQRWLHCHIPHVQ